jgi:hypothetical protein
MNCGAVDSTTTCTASGSDRWLTGPYAVATHLPAGLISFMLDTVQTFASQVGS